MVSSRGFRRIRFAINCKSVVALVIFQAEAYRFCSGFRNNLHFFIFIRELKQGNGLNWMCILDADTLLNLFDFLNWSNNRCMYLAFNRFVTFGYHWRLIDLILMARR
jgi:hypothetical protein